METIHSLLENPMDFAELLFCVAFVLMFRPTRAILLAVGGIVVFAPLALSIWLWTEMRAFVSFAEAVWDEVVEAITDGIGAVGNAWRGWKENRMRRKVDN